MRPFFTSLKIPLHQRASTPSERKLLARLSLSDLSSLSISSVAPLFSMAAAGQLLVRLTGAHVEWAVLAVAVPFVLSAWLFRLLNHHFPNTGASYHWSRRVLGPMASRFQSWVLLMAYFWSIPPIIIPAAQQTLQLLGMPSQSPWLVIAFSAAWIAVSCTVLLLGSRVTARVTQVFMGLEVLSVALLVAVGMRHWHGVVSRGAPAMSWHGFVVAMVVGATIVDGWEIDSYAAEESKKPKFAPGTGGIIGAVMVLVYYLLAWSVMLHNVPIRQLAAHPDVLTTWVGVIAPRWTPVALIPILASTAGSLWLTSFILSRALYAMGRDRILPSALSQVNRFHAPVWGVVVPSAVGLIIVSADLVWPSVDGLFNLVLSAAGFFLVMEFLFDSVTAAIFLTRRHNDLPHGWDRHHHRFLQGLSFITTGLFVGMTAMFVLYGGTILGQSLDVVIGVLLAIGLWFAWAFKKHSAKFHIFRPQEDDQAASEDAV